MSSESLKKSRFRSDFPGTGHRRCRKKTFLGSSRRPGSDSKTGATFRPRQLPASLPVTSGSNGSAAPPGSGLASKLLVEDDPRLQLQMVSGEAAGSTNASQKQGGNPAASPVLQDDGGEFATGSVEWGLRPPGAWKGAAPDRRGDFPVPPLSVSTRPLGGGAFPGARRRVSRAPLKRRFAEGGLPSPPGPPLPGAWKGAAPRRQECRRS